jgi:Dolichyl-phosphate-mannose-protein mannosyltransferase
MADRLAGVSSLLARPWIVLILLGAALLLRVGFAVNGSIDADESEHLHAAWLVDEGRIPYRDFWEHHGPLLYYALVPLTRAFTDNPQVYVAARLAMSIPALALGAFLYVVARRFSPVIGLVSVLLVAFQPGVIQYTTQVRPDVPALAIWLAMVVALIRWRESRAPAWIWATGLLLGVIAAFTPKAVYSLVGVIALVVTIERRGPCPIPAVTRSLLRLGLGAAIPLVLLLATLWVTGGVTAPSQFVRYVIIDNLRFPDLNRRLPIGSEGLILVLLAIAGLVQSVRRLRASIFSHPVHGPLLVPAGVMLLLLLWPRTPAVYEYTWLPIVMVGSVYAALAVEAVSARTARGRAAVVGAVMIVLAFVLPAGLASAAAVHNKNHAALDRMQLELAYACPGDAVFDGTGLYVFRPSATWYPALVIGIRRWIGTGEIDRNELVDELRRSRAPVGLWDRRLASVGGPLATFAERYYVRRPNGLLLAGATVSTERGDTQRTTIELLRTTIYRVAVPPGGVVQIDSRQVSAGPVKLMEGPHVVTWSPTTHGAIEITGSTCAERRAASGGSG